MRILICNKFYYRRGGDCVYAMQLESLLLSHGHEVAVFAMEHPDTVDTLWRVYFPDEVNFDSAVSKLRFFARSMGVGQPSRCFRKLLSDFRPDVVHVGNIHSQLSPIIAEIAHKSGCRVVWTLHDYKLLCPRYDCLKRGESACELCFRDKWNVVRQRCMKDSLAASVASWLEAERWSLDRLEACTDAFICPSLFLMQKMKQGGFDPSKLHHLCNFADFGEDGSPNYSVRKDYYCYVGRLSHEKGIRLLTRVASRLPENLLVVGDGPLMGQLPSAPNIEYTGRKDFETVRRIVRQARFLVLPSEWYENNPLSVIESLGVGTPVLGADIGGIPELIEAGRTGMLFESGNEDDLADRIETMFKTDFCYEAIAVDARKRFSPEKYYESLMNVYSK